MKKRIVNIFYIFILLQPFIDLITSLMTKFLNIDITLGTLIRGLIFLIFIIYILFISKSKYKKYSIIYLIILFLYTIGYFITKKSIFGSLSNLYTEINYMFKYYYTLVVLLGLFNFFDEYKPNNRKIFKILQINLFLYCFIIFLANITGTAFGTYTHSIYGNTGWFFSGNEISVTVALLFPLLFLLINKATSYKALLYVIPIIFGIEFIGTKTSMLGLILPTIIFLIYYLIRIKHGKKKQFIMANIILLIIIISAPNLPVIDNIKDNISKFNTRMSTEEIDEDYSDKVVSSILLSSRDYYEKKINKVYIKSPLSNKFFGIGFTNRKEINNENIKTLIEMDFYDIFYRYGILGIIIYVIPFILITIYVLKKIIESKFKLNKKQLTLLYISYVSIVIAFISGHTLGSPGVSIYLDLSFVLLVYYFKYGYYKIDIFENEITILVNDIESTSTQKELSNLCKTIDSKYKINIVSTYKYNKKDTYLLPNNVNISYLVNDKPYKRENNKIKNIYNYIKLQYFKYIKNMFYIEEIHSKYLITNNYYYNILIGKNKNRDIIAISIEAGEKEEKKYINKIVSSCNNFNYLVLRNKDLIEVYRQELNKTKTQCIYIPNSANEKKVSKEYKKNEKDNNIKQMWRKIIK